MVVGRLFSKRAIACVFTDTHFANWMPAPFGYRKVTKLKQAVIYPFSL